MYENDQSDADYMTEIDEPEPSFSEENSPETTHYRASGSDPLFGFMLGMAVSIGLIPILPGGIDIRYTAAWGALAGVAVLSWLLGNNARIADEDPADLVWGIGLGLLLSLPFLLFFYETFKRTGQLLFPDYSAGVILAYLIFVMPLAETLFFRGLLQEQFEFYYTGLFGTVWSIGLFFPVMWEDILEALPVGLFLAVVLLMMNMMYSYARERNGLAAAWLTQITASLLLFFLPGLL